MDCNSENSIKKLYQAHYFDHLFRFSTKLRRNFFYVSKFIETSCTQTLQSPSREKKSKLNTLGNKSKSNKISITTYISHFVLLFSEQKAKFCNKQQKHNTNNK